MARTETTTVIRRLLEDDRIHQQLGTAGAGVRDAYRRARSLPPERAIQDKAVYDRIRQTAGGLSEAGRRALAKPEPKPSRGRRVALAGVLLATGSVVAWASKNQRAKENRADAGGAVSATSTTTT